MKRATTTLVIFAAAALALATGPGCTQQVESGANLGDLEDCTNDQDDDGDGLADCEDAECAGHPACQPLREVLCDNGSDDDGDGLTDCADADCQVQQVCQPDREVNCFDGVDNDGDGLTDCADFECQQKCDAEHQPELCNDGVDNDGDGLTDCADADCNGLLGCAFTPEICDNGLDDDGNGHLDCDDPACAGYVFCTYEDCFDGVDNTGDGLIDCDDPRCQGATECLRSTTCQPHEVVSCNTTVSGTTAGRVNNLEAYGCTADPTAVYDGPERYYFFTVPVNTWVDVIFTANDPNLELFRLYRFDGGVCGFEGCTVSADNQFGERAISYSGTAGEQYFFVVDGLAGTSGSFSFDLWCENVSGTTP